MSKILVVDDSTVMRKLVIHILDKKGHESTQAADGQEAFDKFDSQAFDLIITDINMPNMNGFELTKKVREHADAVKAKIPVIVISTEFSDKIKNEGKDLGVNAWIVKPCDEDQLLQAIDHFTGSA